MKISVFGLGYVGVVTCACLAENGHEVVGVDVQSTKVDAINRGHAPILEPGLDILLAEAKTAGCISATSSVSLAVQTTDISFICVGTPSLEFGGLDLRHVRHVCHQIAEQLESKTTNHLLLLRSTMLPGSTRNLVDKYFANVLATGRLQVVFFPEFLREGSAISDFRDPSLSVMGSDDGEAVPLAEQLMGQAQWLPWEGAETMKYACNYWHALKVCFANEIGRLSSTVGVNGQALMSILCEDKRLNISTYYMKPGNPYGGSCLPKDISALGSYAAQHGVVLPLLDAVALSNLAHAERLKNLVLGLGGSRVFLLGLAFKENTDDLRNSPMVSLAEGLLSEGFEVLLYDPKVKPSALVGANRIQIDRRLPSLDDLLTQDLDKAIAWAETIVVLHRVLDCSRLQCLVRDSQVIVDINGWPELAQLPSRYVGFCW